MEEARASITADNLLTADLAPLDRAVERIGQARRRLTSPLLLPLRPIPFVGRQLASARALTSSAELMIRPAVRGLHELQATETEGSPIVRMSRYLQVVDGTSRVVQQNLAAVDLGPADGLVTPLADARGELAEALNSLQWNLGRLDTTVQSSLEAIEGERRYLILGGTNAEMAAGAPIPLARGVLTIRNGELSVGEWTWGEDRPIPPSVAPPAGPLTDLWSFVRPTESFYEVTVSPSFALNAPLAADLYEAAYGTRVDGVIMVDAEALISLSGLTGPVELGGVPRSGDELRRYILHDQYASFGSDQTDERHDAILDLTETVFADLVGGSQEPGRLITTLRDLARSRNVLFWSRLAGEQAAATTLGVDGAIDDGDLFVALNNRGANKLDYFSNVTVSVASVDSDASWTTVRLAVAVENAVNPTSEPRYVVGPNANHISAAGEYAGYLSLVAPPGADAVALAGDGPLVVDGYDDKHPVVARLIRIPAGGSWQGEWTFRIPAGRSLSPAPSGRPNEVVWVGLDKLSASTKTQND